LKVPSDWCCGAASFVAQSYPHISQYFGFVIWLCVCNWTFAIVLCGIHVNVQQQRITGVELAPPYTLEIDFRIFWMTCHFFDITSSPQ
jgi:hypothetical protein